MKINWNWGTGIFIAAGLFMLFIIGFVYFMFQVHFDLVEKDYYPKALVYQNRIDKLENTSKLSNKVKVEIIDQTVAIRFPKEFDPGKLTGSVYFYRPSEEKEDITIPIKTDTSGVMSYPLTGLIKGKYLVKLDYSYNNTGYYQEEGLFVP
jgi:hypothetical protein